MDTVFPKEQTSTSSWTLTTLTTDCDLDNINEYVTSITRIKIQFSKVTNLTETYKTVPTTTVPFDLFVILWSSFDV